MPRVSLEIAPEARLVLALPDAAREEPAERLPPMALPPIAGARVTALRGWVADGGLRLRAACVRAPSDRWAPGVEDIVLDRATALARGGLDAELERFAGGDILQSGDRFEQRLDGSGPAVSAVGRHVLGFVGSDRDVFVCTWVCLEPERGDRCAALVDAAEPAGTFTGAPAPSLTTRAILAAAEHPTGAAIAAAVLAIGAVTLVLARRPRPRR